MRKPAVKKLAFKEGDIVSFVGTVHYTTPNKSATGYTCKIGVARVAKVEDRTIHPYYLKAIPGEGATVFGWVDEKDVKPFVPQKEVYTVKEGDTLSDICKTYGVSVNEILRLNKMGKKETLHTGPVLKLK